MGPVRTLAVAAATVLVAPLLAALAAAPAQAADLCAAAPEELGAFTRYTWTGGAPSDDWSLPANWAVAGAEADPDRPVPGETLGDGVDHTQDAVVCIDPVEPTTITATEVFPHVAALIVGPNAAIDAQKSWILAYGGPGGTLRSSFAAGSTLSLADAYFGGTAAIDFNGHLVWAQPGSGTSSLTNDICDIAGLDLAVCNGSTKHLTATGQIVLGADGSVEVNGRGVNLLNGFRVDALAGSTVDVVGTGYIAADQNTRITLRADAELTFDGDGNIFEGHLNGNSLPDLVNQGSVRKVSGSGVSSLNADYSGTGTVQVDTGTLNIANGTATRTVLAAGTTLGTATCPEDADGGLCESTTSSTDLQSAALTLPDASSGVSLAEGTSKADPADLLPPVTVAGEVPSGESTITLSFDQSTPNLPTNRTRVTVFRGPSVSIPYCSDVPGAPNGTVTACVNAPVVSGRTTRYVVRTLVPLGTWRIRSDSPHFIGGTVPLVGAPAGCEVTTRAYPPSPTSKRIWIKGGGAWELRWSTRSDVIGTSVIASGNLTSNSAVVRFRVTRTGWVVLIQKATGAHSAAYRVVATGAVDLTHLTRRVPRGKKVILTGDVDGGGSRSYVLYAQRPGSTSVLRATSVRGTTSARGGFRAVFRVPASAPTGRWWFAVRIGEKGLLRPGMSDRALRVWVVRPAPTQPAVVLAEPADRAVVLPPTPEVDRPVARLGCSFRVS